MRSLLCILLSLAFTACVSAHAWSGSNGQGNGDEPRAYKDAITDEGRR